MSKKLIIGISAGMAAAVIIVIGFLCIRVSSKTNEAKDAASEFVALMQTGELEQLSLAYYAYSPEENEVFRDENGVIKGQTISDQQMAEKYGAKAVMGGYGESNLSDVEAAVLSEEEIFKIIMEHTQIAGNVGTVWGGTAKLNLQMMVPDLKTWLLGLTAEEALELNAIETNQKFLQELGSRMESGEITTQYKQMVIPMLKQNGRWRFQVTEEMEQAFFGGLYNLFDTEEKEITE